MKYWKRRDKADLIKTAMLLDYDSLTLSQKRLMYRHKVNYVCKITEESSTHSNNLGFLLSRIQQTFGRESSDYHIRLTSCL